MPATGYFTGYTILEWSKQDLLNTMFDYMPFGRISIVHGKIDYKCHNYRPRAFMRTVLHTG